MLNTGDFLGWDQAIGVGVWQDNHTNYLVPKIGKIHVPVLDQPACPSKPERNKALITTCGRNSACLDALLYKELY